MDKYSKEKRFKDMSVVRRSQQMTKPTNIIILDPDIVEAFPNAEAVNQALRLLLQLAKTSVHPVSS